jgi:sugar transferase (PEP-CTERM/EpsH1 system associated)
LSEHANVSLATLADEPTEQRTIDVLGSLTTRLAIEPIGKSRWLRAMTSLAGGRPATEGLFYSPRLMRTVRAWSRQTRWDAALVYCSSMVQYTRVPELKEVPVVVDLVDVDSQKFFDYAEHARGPRRWLFRLEGRRLRRLESSLADQAKAVTLVSEPEAALYRSFCPNPRTFAVPNGVDLDYFRPQNDGRAPWTELAEADRTNLVFVGALDYHANVDGITWFAREVWPLVRRTWPDLMLGLVGRNPTPAVQRLAEMPGVRLFANVPDVRPYVAAADVTIAPLRIARGIQNKVLEAMAMGKAVVGTPQALEGVHADGDTAIAAPLGQWPQVLTRVLGDRQRLDNLGRRGREFVEQQFAWSTAAAALRNIITESWDRNCIGVGVRQDLVARDGSGYENLVGETSHPCSPAYVKC